jgi:hypothetical protein
MHALKDDGSVTDHIAGLEKKSDLAPIRVLSCHSAVRVHFFLALPAA